jgi:DNA-directed RNA polymerase specialized sigma subunit
MPDHKTPPSEMIRVPTALIPVFRELSRLHRQGRTIALLQALEELVSQFDSNNDINIPSKLEDKLDNLESHLDTKLEAITKKLEQIERAMASLRYNNARPQRQASTLP